MSDPQLNDLAARLVDYLTPRLMQRIYASGAWLPTLTTAGGSVTHASQRGTYTRIGGQVHFHAQIVLSAISTPTGDVTISGLPLPAAQRGGAWIVNVTDVAFDTGYTFLSGHIAAGASAITLRQQGDNVAALTLPGTALAATTVLEIAGQYDADEVPAVSVEDAILARSPIAYWPLNETSGTVAVDVSGNGYNGAYSSVALGVALPPFTAARMNDGALDGYGDMTAAGLPAAITPSGLTLLAFGYTDNVTSKTLFAINVNGTNFIQLVLLSNGRIRLRHNASALVNVDAPNQIALQTWVMVAATITAPGTVRLYINGVEVMTGTVAAAISGTPAAILVGANSTVPGAPWSDELAHVALFDTVLSPADIADIYLASGL